MEAGVTWTRVEIPGAGRSICDRPGTRDRLVIIARDGGYDCTVATGTVYYSTANLAAYLLRAGRTLPTAEDLAWLWGDG